METILQTLTKQQSALNGDLRNPETYFKTGQSDSTCTAGDSHGTCLATTEPTRQEANTIKNRGNAIWLDRFVEDLGNGSLKWQ